MIPRHRLHTALRIHGGVWSFDSQFSVKIMTRMSSRRRWMVERQALNDGVEMRFVLLKTLYSFLDVGDLGLTFPHQTPRVGDIGIAGRLVVCFCLK